MLLHFRDNPGEQHRHAVQDMLGAFIPAYDKHLEFSQLFQGIADASRRARQLDAHAAEEGEPGRNPTTTVYDLADSMQRRDGA